MTISIIIAVKTWQKNLEECVSKCLALDFADFEVIILPDAAISQDHSNLLLDKRLKVIPTGEVNPARKRDIAIDSARGEILAFIDDDAYPEKDWLKNAVRAFSLPEVAAVGGPAVTAQSDGMMQRASGLIYSSLLVGGNYAYRYLAKKRREVDDYPSCNFLVRKSIMKELGGFKTNFWPGEDTKLCLEITKRLKNKIIYDPEALVYHHRRPLYLAHLKQIASYAFHRGYFVKKFPDTSLKISYFLPSLLLAAVAGGGFLSVLILKLRIIYLSGLFSYFILAFIFSISKELGLIPHVFIGIILTHFTYGFYFIKGLLSNRLKEEL